MNDLIDSVPKQPKKKPLTNGDIIRQMTYEELASILELHDCYGNGYRCPE